LANPRDQYHERAVATGRRFLESGGRWVGTALVLAEFHGHVLHRRGPAAARTVVSALLDDPVYQWRDVPVALVRAAIAGWLARFRHLHFSLSDAVSFELLPQERLMAALDIDEDVVAAG